MLLNLSLANDHCEIHMLLILCNCIAETKRKKESLNLATSRAIVLGTSTKKKDPSYTAIYCPNLLVSNFTFVVEMWTKRAFFPWKRQPKRQRCASHSTPPTVGQLYLLQQQRRTSIHMSYFAVSVRHKQTSPLRQKPCLSATFSTFQGPYKEDGSIFKTCHQLIDCTLGDG